MRAPINGTARARFTSHHLRLPSPARRPQSRESGLCVFRYVASIRLSLDFHAPISIGQNEDWKRSRPARRSEGRATLRRWYEPIPRHIYGLCPSSFPSLGISARGISQIVSSGHAAGTRPPSAEPAGPTRRDRRIGRYDHPHCPQSRVSPLRPFLEAAP